MGSQHRDGTDARVVLLAEVRTIGPHHTPIRDRIRRASGSAYRPRNVKPQEEEPTLPPFTPGEAEDRNLLTCAAAEIHRMRRQRDLHLPGSLLGEAAWDILLTLYVDRYRDVTVAELCQSANIPSTTASRWVQHLVSEGYLSERPAPGGGREILATLTLAGQDLMDRCLGAILRDPPASPAGRPWPQGGGMVSAAG